MFCIFSMQDFYTNITAVLICYIALFEPSDYFDILK